MDENREGDEKEGEEKENEKREDIVPMECCGNEVETSPEELKGRVVLKLGKGLGERGNVIMTRLDDHDLEQIDALIEVCAFRSRSEAAAFFIKEGIQARRDLLEKVIPMVQKIRELKEQARKSLIQQEGS